MTKAAALGGIMFNKIVDGILDCIFMALFLATAILGTLVFGL